MPEHFLPVAHTSQAYLLEERKVSVRHVCLKYLLGAASALPGVEQEVSPRAAYLPLAQLLVLPLEHDLPAGQGSQPTLPPLVPCTVLPLVHVVAALAGSVHTSVPEQFEQEVCAEFNF